MDVLNVVDNLVAPKDLQKVFDTNRTAFENWGAFPPSAKKGILEWISNAKRDETRAKRIAETIEKAEQNVRVNHWR